MKTRHINFVGIFLILFVGVLLISGGFKRRNLSGASELYQVYLDGEKIGILEDEEELYNIIDREQELIKEEFGVDKVYPPSGLKTTKYLTYSKNFKSANEIYNKIAEESTFTILGYTVTFKTDDGKPLVINILNKEDLEPALLNFAKALVTDEKQLENYLNGTQIEIVDTGKTIQNIMFKETITIKENYIPVNEEIIMNEKDLTNYLLFGTFEKSKKYTVKEGDTVESIAEDNQLNSIELLVANPNLSGVNALLTPGQELYVDLVSPLIHVIEEDYEVKDEPIVYETVHEKDPNMYVGKSEVKQEGAAGIKRVSRLVNYDNGEELQGVTSKVSEQEILAPIKKIIVDGTKQYSNYNPATNPPAITESDWGWPTMSGYILTSRVGWRWGKLHAGLDISGGNFFGSPIYSATEGTVIATVSSCADYGSYGNMCGGSYGNHVRVSTPSGMTIIYGHLRSSVQVSVGQHVSKGQLLGYMGSSGSSTGPHLHFEIRDANNSVVNPCSIYGC